MEKKTLGFLYKEFENAVSFCNEELEKDGNEGFAPELIPENFLEDVLLLSFYAICADREVSEEEIDKLNSLLASSDISISPADAKEALDFIGSIDFEIPKSLDMFKLRAALKLRNPKTENREAILEEQLKFFDDIMCIYADLMRWVAEELSQQEKDVIYDCLHLCRDCIASTLGVPFELSEAVINIIEK